MRKFFLFFFLVFLLSGCVSFPSLTAPKEPVGQGTAAFTGIIGGRGVQAGFVPNNPPLNKIDGPFGLALQFFNFNQEPVTLDSFTVGSTGVYPGFANFADESITLEGAHIREADSGPVFLGPGTDYTYTGQAQRQRDGSLHYGDFQFVNTDPGAGTTFFVDMTIQDYLSKSYFQFCVFDLLSSVPLGSCPTTQTLTGPQLGFSYRYDPVAVTSVVRNLGSLKDGIRVTLDITLEDRSEQQARISSGKAFEQGQILPTDSYEQLFFEIEPTTGRGISFTCTSPQQRYASERQGTYLTLVLQEKKAVVHCTGYDSLLDERRDYQYQATLHYPYRQTISTSYIPIASNTQQPFS